MPPRRQRPESDDDSEPLAQAVPSKLARRSAAADVPASRSNPLLGSNEQAQQDFANDTRPKRTNRGQGGRADQLEKVGNLIRPDLKSRAQGQSKPGANIPKEAPVNNMAPVAPKAKGRAPAKPQPKPITQPLRQGDPPLRLEAPKPVQQRTESQDTRFGFKLPKAPLQTHREPPSANPRSQGQEPVQTQSTHWNHTSREPPLPPSKARIFDRFPVPASASGRTTIAESQFLDEETVPDSEEEQHQQKPESDGDTGQASSEEEDSDATSEEQERGVGDGEDDDEADLAHDLGMTLDINHEIDEAVLAEMDLDPFANENFGPEEEMNINEVSPDKEDQRNPKSLRSNQGNDDEEANNKQGDDSQPFSVLGAHHKTNRKICAPNPRNLEHVSNNQRPTFSKKRGQKQTQRRVKPEVNLHKSNDENSGRKKTGKRTTHRMAEPEESQADDEESDDEDPGKKKRAPRHSKSKDKKPKPTQARYYSHPWPHLIELAKNYYRFQIHTQEPFPNRTSRTLGVAEDCFLGAVNLYQEDKRNPRLDEDAFDMHSLSILIFEDGPSTRSKLKTKTHTLFKQHYKKIIKPVIKHGHNSDERIRVIECGIKYLLKDGQFLRGGHDENGKTKNFANPLFEAICHEFYYSGEANCLAVLFPDEFRELPRECLALVCTCVINCLREYVDGSFKRLNFSGKVYAAVYYAILKLIDQVDADEYHGPRLQQMLKDIGEAGMAQCMPEDPSPEMFGLKVDL